MDFEIKDSSKLVTENEIKKAGGIIYNPEDNIDREAPVNLPNTDDILTAVEKILEHMCTDKMMVLNETNRPEYEKQMEQQFPEFSSKYYSLFQMIMSGEDISNLFMMLEYMDQVNKGEADFEDVQKQFGANLKEKYVYEVDELEDGESVDDSWMDADSSVVDGTGEGTKKKKKKKKKKK